jgi:hypothetical protein
VSYVLEASDQAALMAALRDLGHDPRALDHAHVRVLVPSEAAADLLRQLALRGVTLSEARRETDSLEGAYLRLLREDGRPS